MPLVSIARWTRAQHSTAKTHTFKIIQFSFSHNICQSLLWCRLSNRFLTFSILFYRKSVLILLSIFSLSVAFVAYMYVFHLLDFHLICVPQIFVDTLFGRRIFVNLFCFGCVMKLCTDFNGINF